MNQGRQLHEQLPSWCDLPTSWALGTSELGSNAPIRQCRCTVARGRRSNRLKTMSLGYATFQPCKHVRTAWCSNRILFSHSHSRLFCFQFRSWISIANWDEKSKSSLILLTASDIYPSKIQKPKISLNSKTNASKQKPKNSPQKHGPKKEKQQQIRKNLYLGLKVSLKDNQSSTTEVGVLTL